MGVYLRQLEVKERLLEHWGEVLEVGTGRVLRRATRRDYERAVIEQVRAQSPAAAWTENGALVTLRGRG